MWAAGCPTAMTARWGMPFRLVALKHSKHEMSNLLVFSGADTSADNSVKPARDKVADSSGKKDIGKDQPAAPEPAVADSGKALPADKASSDDATATADDTTETVQTPVADAAGTGLDITRAQWRVAVATNEGIAGARHGPPVIGGVGEHAGNALGTGQALLGHGRSRAVRADHHAGAHAFQRPAAGAAEGDERVALIVTLAAWENHESRGAHYRE